MTNTIVINGRVKYREVWDKEHDEWCDALVIDGKQLTNLITDGLTDKLELDYPDDIDGVVLNITVEVVNK